LSGGPFKGGAKYGGGRAKTALAAVKAKPHGCCFDLEAE
jgi:hypothetical protein